jgi:hypothetical protein
MTSAPVPPVILKEPSVSAAPSKVNTPEFAAFDKTSMAPAPTRALTDVIKLVNEGYIRINRATNEVSTTAERSSL